MPKIVFAYFLFFVLLKINSRSEASAADASEVVEVLRHSLYDTYTDECDELAFDRSLHGSGVSVKNKFKRLLNALVKVRFFSCLYFKKKTIF